MSLTKSQTNIAAMLAKAGRKVSVIDASDPRKAPIVQEFNHNPVMSMEDEAAALAAELRRRTAERDQLATMGAELRAENQALAARLREQPEMREVIGELRTVQDWLHNGMDRQARRSLSELLRRLDESPQ